MGGIRNGFAASHLGVSLIKNDGVSAEFLNADLKRNARPGGRLGENHADAFSGKRLDRLRCSAFGFQFPGKFNDFIEIIASQTLARQQIFVHIQMPPMLFCTVRKNRVDV